MKKVLVVQEIHPEGMEILRREAEVIIPPDVEETTLLEIGSPAEALVVRLTRVTERLLNGLPSLKVVGRNGVGVDNIDISAATARKIVVVNTPGVNNLAVAEYTAGVMLALARKILIFNKNVRCGRYEIRNSILGTELAGKTLGLIGFGSVGRAVAEKAAALGMAVSFYDPYYIGLEDGLKRVAGLEDVLAGKDFISVHVPLTPETSHLIGKEEFRLMSPTAYLINASRGGIVDESALYEALAAGKIAGAAVDVLAVEPFPEKHPLYSLDNLIITPHIAGMTEECMARMGSDLARDVLRALNGQRPANLVNPEVWEY